MSEEILYYTKYSANAKEIKDSPPFSLETLIDDYIKISTKFFVYLNNMTDEHIFRKPIEPAGEKWYELLQRITLHFMGHTGQISILRKEIEGKGYDFVEGINENERKRVKDEWLRWWDENKHLFTS